MNDNGQNEQELTAEQRVAFLESLIEHDDPWSDNGPFFVQHLDDEDPQVRAVAIQGLWFSPDPALVNRLIEIAEQDPSPMVRARAIGGLGIYMYEGEMADYDFDWGQLAEILREDELPQADFVRARDFLLGVYADETRSLDERRFAIESLGFLSDPEVAYLVEEAYNRPERDMKISALFAMGRGGLIRWTEILRRELNNADRGIQREAIRAAGEIGLTELGKDLWRLTYADDRDLMLEAVEALGQTGWEGAFERLEELTIHPDQEIAQLAEEALEEWFLMDKLQREDYDLELDWDEDDLPD
jgi:HEAT repeat protein